MKGHLLGALWKGFLNVPKRDVTCLLLKPQQPPWGCEGSSLSGKADEQGMAEGKGEGAWVTVSHLGPCFKGTNGFSLSCEPAEPQLQKTDAEGRCSHPHWVHSRTRTHVSAYTLHVPTSRWSCVEELTSFPPLKYREKSLVYGKVAPRN